MKKTPLIQCHHCHGTGEVPLSDDMLATLNAVRFLKEATAPQVASRLKWKGEPTAINNRLTDLMALGFLKRRRQSRFFLYSPS